MKTSICIFLFSIFLCVSCKNDTKSQNDNQTETTTQNNGLATLKGEFIYYNGAAVLQVDNTVYGVILNEKAKEINTKATQYKAEPTDGVQVEVRGKIIAKPEDKDGWPFNVDIQEIIDIKKLDQNKSQVVKIGK